MSWVIEYAPKKKRARLFASQGKPILFNTYALAVNALTTVFPSRVDIANIDYAGVTPHNGEITDTEPVKRKLP